MKSEKFKLYLVIGLAIVAAGVAYFRFIHKSGAPAARIVPTPPPQAQPEPALVNAPPSLRPPTFRRPLTEPVDMDIRDIFAPLQLPKKPEPPAPKKPAVQSKRVDPAPVVAPPPPAPPPPLTATLKGTVIGGNEPLAIINDAFVRLGEKVGDYQVVGITANEVYLKAGKHQRVLQVLNPAQK